MRIIFTLTLLLLQYAAMAQCTNVPVKEAVRNGDFELGYLTASGSKHLYTAGGNLDFYSDFAFAGNTPTSNSAPCYWDMGDKYVVAKAETFKCDGGTSSFTNNPYWGVNYLGAANFKDHTKGASGYALLVDLKNLTTSSETGGKPIAWEQHMDIVPNQTYWFSAWIANYHTGTPPIMQVSVLPYSNGVLDNSGITVLPVSGAATGLMVWNQMSTSWVPTQTYDAVTLRFEFVNVSGGASGLDIAIDDISFINSCQNLSGQNAYVADFSLPDTVNLCTYPGTTVSLDPKVPSGQRNNASITWYSGSGNSQTEIANGVWTKDISAVGEYRVCVQDPDNNCAVSDRVVFVENPSAQVNDLVLCSPSTYTLDAGITTPTVGVSSINWSGASGTSTSKTYTVNKSGSHSLNYISAAGHSCTLTKTFNVTSKMPIAPTNLEICDGSSSPVHLTVGDGLAYKWSTSPIMLPLIGSGVNVSWTPAGSGDKTLYLQSAVTTPAGTMTGPAAVQSSWVSSLTTDINVHQTINIKSAMMGLQTYSGACLGAGTSTTVLVEVLDASNAVVESKTVTVPCGVASEINLNITLQAGQYKLRATGNGGAQLWTTENYNNATSPNLFSLAGYLDITSYSAHCGAFGNLKIEQSEACDPIPVLIKAKVCCTPPTDNPKIDYTTSVLEVCEPSSATIVSKTLSNALDYQWQVSHNNGTTWKDTLSASVVSGGKVNLSGVNTNGWYRLVIATTGNLGESCVKYSDSAVVKIKPLPKNISVTVSPLKTEFCAGESYTLNASATGAVSYSWKLDGSSTSASIQGKTTPGIYLYKVVATLDGCVDSSNVSTVTVNALDSASLLDIGAMCSSAEAINVSDYLSAGSSTGGAFSGSGITDSSLGTFDPFSLLEADYWIKYTTAGKCKAVDSVSIKITSSINLSFSSGQNLVFCKNASAQTLQVNQLLAGATFYSFSGTGISNATSGVFDPSLSSVNVDTIYYSKSGTCGDTAKAVVEIYNVDTASINPASTMCESEGTFQCTVSANSSAGSWSSDCGICLSTSGVFDPSIAQAGQHKIIYSTKGQCPDADTILITVVAPQNIQITSAGPFCSNASNQQLQVNKSGGIWSGAVDANGLFSPLTSGSGSHQVKYTLNGVCVSSDSISVAVNQLPQVKIDPERIEGCVPLTLTFVDSSNAASSLAIWNFDDGTIENKTQSNGKIQHVFKNAGSYSVNLKVQFLNGCEDSSTAKINVLEVPEADFSMSAELVNTQDPSVQFFNHSFGATQYIWLFGDSVSTHGDPFISSNFENTVVFDPTHAEAKSKKSLGADSVWISLLAMKGGCADTARKMLMIRDVFTLFTPNAFTPNDDNVNDLFFPNGVNILCETCSNYKFMIFNRWGELIFESSTPYEGWNGKKFNNMNPVEIDTYVWRVEYTDSFTNKSGKKMGSVSVIR